jgi:hypothetical protein
MKNTPSKETHKHTEAQTDVGGGCKCDGDCACDCGRGMTFEPDDIKLIYRALRAYQPMEREEQLHEILVEQFEEVLAVDFEMLDIAY